MGLFSKKVDIKGLFDKQYFIFVAHYNGYNKIFDRGETTCPPDKRLNIVTEFIAKGYNMSTCSQVVLPVSYYSGIITGDRDFLGETSCFPDEFWAGLLKHLIVFNESFSEEKFIKTGYEWLIDCKNNMALIAVEQ